MALGVGGKRSVRGEQAAAKSQTRSEEKGARLVYFGGKTSRLGGGGDNKVGSGEKGTSGLNPGWKRFFRRKEGIGFRVCKRGGGGGGGKEVEGRGEGLSLSINKGGFMVGGGIYWPSGGERREGSEKQKDLNKVIMQTGELRVQREGNCFMGKEKICCVLGRQGERHTKRGFREG